MIAQCNYKTKKKYILKELPEFCYIISNNIIFVLEVFKGRFPWVLWQAAMAHWQTVKTNPRVAKSIHRRQNKSAALQLNCNCPATKMQSLNYFSAGIPAGSPYKLPCKIWSPQLKKWYQVPKHRGHYQSVIIISTDYYHYTVQTFFCQLFKVWTMYIILESSFVPSAITLPFFDLQTPDFAWKFVWTVPTKWTSMQIKIAMESMQENSMDHGISYNSAIF